MKGYLVGFVIASSAEEAMRKAVKAIEDFVDYPYCEVPDEELKDKCKNPYSFLSEVPSLMDICCSVKLKDANLPEVGKVVELKLKECRFLGVDERDPVPPLLLDFLGDRPVINKITKGIKECLKSPPPNCYLVMVSYHW